MRACSSDGYELFGHLGGLRNRPGELADYPGGLQNRPGGLATYPSGFTPEASPLEAPDPAGGNPLW